MGKVKGIIYLYLLSVVLLAGLMLYSLQNYHAYYPSLATAANDPLGFEGIEAENCGIVEELIENGFILRAGIQEVPVYTYNARFPKYGTVCVAGVYQADGSIVASTVRYNDYIFGKYLLSALSIVFVVYLFFSEWKVTKKGFVLRRKDA